MRKALLVFGFALLGFSPLALAETFYISQSGGSVSCGADGTQSTSAASFYNTSGNWGAGAGKISAGDTVQLCGTISSIMDAKGGGSVGSPVTVHWETGAKVSLATCTTTCMTANNLSYFTFDGGTACGPGTTCKNTESGTGIIEATASGSSFGRVAGRAIEINNSNHIEVKNLIIRNIYIHNTSSDNTQGPPDDPALFCSTCDNVHFHDSYVHDTGWTVTFQASSSSLEVDHIAFDRYEHGVSQLLGSSDFPDGLLIHHNDFGDNVNWDCSGHGFHHDPIHLGDASTAGGHHTNVYIYDNTFHGDMGQDSTAVIYFGQGNVDATIYNNLVIGPPTYATTNQFFTLDASGTIGGTVFLYNNTLISTIGAAVDPNGNRQGCLKIDGLHFTAKNNIFAGCDNFVSTGSGITSSAKLTFDYNLYQNSGGSGNSWHWDATASAYSTIAAWKAQSGEGSVSFFNATTGLNSLGVPQTGSVAIHNSSTRFLNLTSSCTGNLALLCSDIISAARPNTANGWEAGAFQFGTPIRTADFFGIHMAAPSGTVVYPSSLGLPFGIQRIWDSNTGCNGTAWEKINTSDGVFDYTCMDALVALASTNNKELIYTFGRTPAWASANSTDAVCAYGGDGACDPPTNLAKFQAFANNMVQRYGGTGAGQVKYWEVWNEPNLQRFYRGDIAGNIAKLVTMGGYVRTAINTFCPTCVLVSPAPTSTGDYTTGEGVTYVGGPHLFLNDYFTRGGDADILAYHNYSDPNNPEGSAKTLANQMRDSVTARAGRPVWNTEFANDPSTPAYLSRSMIFLAGRDEIARSFWYGWDYTTRSLWDVAFPTVLTTSGTAFVQVAAWLNSATFTDPLNTTAGTRCTCTGSNCPNIPASSQVWACNISKTGYVGRMVWDRFGASSYATGAFNSYRTVNNATVFPVVASTVTLGTTPILLEVGAPAAPSARKAITF